MTFDQITWLPLCAGLTAVGIALSYLAFRRRGAAAGLRATAWSLLPLAAYLTGVHRTLWNIGSSLVGFVTGLVLSPVVWAGVALAGLSALLFFVSGALRGRALSRARTAGTGSTGGTAGTAQPGASGSSGGAAGRPGRSEKGDKPAAAKPVEQSAGNAATDDFSDIEAILKRRGIS
ncbi:cellulose synthase [Planotetraspora sp. A-T 1434]|uniref:cellulose synthase n=1 Tax=Planotetraspora sp. A-T 1434 TaxID=2979219 RepID=UPI0021C04AA3|nr:cellulose synthase [Planotetraspora sp. A-T 1434]MCT9935030.1 cellulose synthase [Planotetraspora sp. A-T 1434]